MMQLTVERAVRLILIGAVAFIVSIITAQYAMSEEMSEDEKIEAEIWAKEFAIFEGRSEGDLSNYLNVTSSSYLGWPPVMKEPLGLDKFRASASESSALKGEVTNITKKGFTRQGDTAIAYFLTHRTRLGDGFAPEGEREVDQYYENIHVWTIEDGEWRLVGGMARLLPEGPRQ